MGGETTVDRIGISIEHKGIYIAAMMEETAVLLPSPEGRCHPAYLCTQGQRTRLFTEDMDAQGFRGVFSYALQQLEAAECTPEEAVVTLPGAWISALGEAVQEGARMAGLVISRMITACDGVAAASSYRWIQRCFARADRCQQDYQQGLKQQFLSVQIITPHRFSLGHYRGQGEITKISEQEKDMMPNEMGRFWDESTQMIMVSAQNAGIPGVRKLERQFPGRLELCPEGWEAMGALRIADQGVYLIEP